MSSHSAPGPLAGYMWQLSRALLALFDRESDEFVELETLDDILIGIVHGALLASVQAKHSFDEQVLTVHSTAVWKTLRAWISSLNKVPPSAALELATTLEVDPQLTCLTTSERTAQEVTAVGTALAGVASEGANKALLSAYAAWAGLSPEQREGLLNRVTIVAAEPKLKDTTTELDARLHKHGIAANQVHLYREPLIGWFTGTVTERLGKGGCRVTAAEFVGKLIELRNDIRPAALVCAFAAAPAPELASERQSDPVYLRQLDIIEAPEELLIYAVAMHHRARAERDRWLQDHLLGEQSLNAFDDDLVNGWQLARADMPAGTEVERGRRVHLECMRYVAALRGEQVPLHVRNGSFYMLSQRHSLAVIPEI